MLGIYPVFAKRKVNIPAITRPQRGRGNKWLVHKSHVAPWQCTGSSALSQKKCVFHLPILKSAQDKISLSRIPPAASPPPPTHTNKSSLLMKLKWNNNNDDLYDSTLVTKDFVYLVVIKFCNWPNDYYCKRIRTPKDCCNLIKRSALAVNCWVIILYLVFSCKGDQITSASDLSAYNWPTNSETQ